MWQGHTYGESKIDPMTGATGRECIKCGAVCWSDDDSFNTVCMVNTDNIKKERESFFGKVDSKINKKGEKYMKKKIIMPKCPKTVSGKHEWVHSKIMPGFPSVHVLFLTHPECSLCGIVDDTQK